VAQNGNEGHSTAVLVSTPYMDEAARCTRVGFMNAGHLIREGTPAELRAGSLRLLAGVGAADLRRTAAHPELGSVTLDQMVHEWAAHDLMHTVQAERALMQPFIDGCGPWREYFLDHVVKS